MSTARNKKISTKKKVQLRLVRNESSAGLPEDIESPKEPVELADRQELTRQDERLDPSDSNFRSELNYDGYQTIEESDNDAYGSLDAERNEDTPREVEIEDREMAPDSGEEDLIDPQDNRNRTEFLTDSRKLFSA